MRELLEHHRHTGSFFQKPPTYLRFYVVFMTMVDASCAPWKRVVDAVRRSFRKSLKVLKIYEVKRAQAPRSIRHIENTYDFSGLGVLACVRKKVLPLPPGRSVESCVTSACTIDAYKVGIDAASPL